MSFRFRRLVPLASIALVTAVPPALAQNWFEKLFPGGDTQAPARGREIAIAAR